MASRWEQLKSLFASSEQRCDKPSCVDGLPGRTNLVYPPDRVQIGRANWRYVHSRASHFPEEPTQFQKDQELRWIESFIYTYPCKICASSFADICSRVPPIVTSRIAYEDWWIFAHDEVNRDLSKPVFKSNSLE